MESDSPPRLEQHPSGLKDTRAAPAPPAPASSSGCEDVKIFPSTSQLVHSVDAVPAQHMSVPHVTPPGLETSVSILLNGAENLAEAESVRRWLPLFVVFLGGGLEVGRESPVRQHMTARFALSDSLALRRCHESDNRHRRG